MREHPELELDNEDSDSQTAWTLQRAGWIVMLLLILLAILGVFGAGPVDRAQVSGEGIELSYSRFPRMSSTAELDLTVSAAQGQTTEIWIDRNYSRRFEISSVTPQPESSTSSRERVTYSFRSRAGQPLVVMLQLRASNGTFGFIGQHRD